MYPSIQKAKVRINFAILRTSVSGQILSFLEYYDRCLGAAYTTNVSNPYFFLKLLYKSGDASYITVRLITRELRYIFLT
jgi:hypothetical protein